MSPTAVAAAVHTTDNPAILGREFQLKELLAFINRQRIKGVVFITADVHMASAIEYSPARATGGFTVRNSSAVV